MTVSITGASGFIGSYLVRALADVPDIRLLCLTRALHGSDRQSPREVNWISGGIEDDGSLHRLLSPGGTLVHLAYPAGWSHGRHLAAAEQLARTAAQVGTTRVVLCSTAVVAGCATENPITEETRCRPTTDYERTKLQIEQTFAAVAKDTFELAVLRPTAVVGPGSRNLQKLAADLSGANWILNYLRSSLYGRRRLNLVCVENVVAALEFLIRRRQTRHTELYIVSDDDDPSNNFRDVEEQLMSNLGVSSYPLPRIPIPPELLRALLRARRRSCVDPMRTFSGDELRRAGCQKVTTLEAGIERFCHAGQ
jgi:nucleoside-diphosphate-sugar epimerase